MNKATKNTIACRSLIICLLLYFATANDIISAQSDKKLKLVLPDITVVTASLPLNPDKINFSSKKETSKAIKEKIENVVTAFYFNDCIGDSTETYCTIRNVYFNTIEFSSKDLTFYLVILDQIGGWGLQGRLICYNHLTKMFYPDILQINLRNLYDFDENHLSIIQSNLREIFDLQAPVIEKIASLDSSDIFRVNELYHNGTSNAIETTMIKFRKDYRTDTLDSKQIWIGLGSENE
jgi:hypothetical protein